jgi:hypothetical protein
LKIAPFVGASWFPPRSQLFPENLTPFPQIEMSDHHKGIQ